MDTALLPAPWPHLLNLELDFSTVRGDLKSSVGKQTGVEWRQAKNKRRRHVPSFRSPAAVYVTPSGIGYMRHRWVFTRVIAKTVSVFRVALFQWRWLSVSSILHWIAASRRDWRSRQIAGGWSAFDFAAIVAPAYGMNRPIARIWSI